LNERQLEACTTDRRTLCVTAGPGSGKTRVLVARALWLMSEGLEPSEVLLTTFTRKAAQAIKERITLERAGSGAVRVYTIHALAHRSLLEEGGCGLRLAPEDFLAELARRLSKGTGASPRRLLQMISRSKNLQRPFGHRVPALAAAMAGYRKALEKFGYMDFDDLLELAVPAAEKRAGAFKAVLADESQDLSPLEYRFLSAVAGGSSLFMIGDPAQRIYGFKGALPSFERTLSEDRPDLGVVRLNVNYRSKRLLNKAAEHIRIPRDSGGRVAASRDEGPSIVRAELPTPPAEAYYILGRLKAHFGPMFLGGGGGSGADELKGLTLGDVAIIYRLRIQGEEILKTLVEEGLPCQISGEDEATSQDGLDLKADKISLLTMHASKGLEFRLVFVTGLEEGIIPAGPWYEGEPREGAEDRLEEEQRLFYVAVTRAKELLYLTRAKRRRLHGRFLSGEPSPFWTIIPQEYIIDKRPAKQRRVVRHNTLF
jgi:DNA helicase-2/ATP-dependent DNA helicase PcrA